MIFLDHSWEGNGVFKLALKWKKKKKIDYASFSQLFVWFFSSLHSRDLAQDAIFYSYTRHINGFAATLEDEVAAQIASEKLFPCYSVFPLFLYLYHFELGIIGLYSWSNAEHPRVVSVFLNQGRKLHTTHSWSFLGLEQNGAVASNSIWRKARYGEDTIIGNLDTGE